MGTHFRGTREQVVALDAYITLQRASESINALLYDHLRASGLSLRQFAVLEALYHLGPLRQREIAEKMLCTAGNITGVIDTLEREGFVVRGVEDGDRRANRIGLTDRGRELIRKVFPRHVEQIVSGFQALSQREQRQLQNLCRRLGLHAHAERTTRASQNPRASQKQGAPSSRPARSRRSTS